MLDEEIVIVFPCDGHPVHIPGVFKCSMFLAIVALIVGRDCRECVSRIPSKLLFQQHMLTAHGCLFFSIDFFDQYLQSIKKTRM